MPQKKLHPDFIPDSETDNTASKTAKSSTNLHPDFIPDSDEGEGQDVSSDEPSAWKSLTSGVSSWINEHPSIRRAISGPTDEERALEQNPNFPFKDASKTELARNYLEAPERGIVSYKGKDIGSMYDELRTRNTNIYAGQPWKAAAASLATEPARFLTDLFNDPFVLASGGPGKVFSKAGGAYGDLKAARARVPQVADLGNVAPEGQKLLGPGPRFQAEPIDAEIVPDVADTRTGESFPIRQSREIPYRPTTDITSGDISPVRTEPFPYKTPQPEIPTGRLAQSYSTAYGDTPRAAEARRRFAEEAAREPITDESRLLPEGVRQPQVNDLLLSEEGKLPGEMSTADALMYEPEFKPWRGLSNLSEAILGRDIMKRDINAGLDPHRGPIDWGPAEETPLISSRPKSVDTSEFIPEEDQTAGGIYTGKSSHDLQDFLQSVRRDIGAEPRTSSYPGEIDDLNRMFEKAPSEVQKPTAKFKGWQQTGYEDMPDFPLYDVEGGASHGTTTDAAGLKKLGIEPPSEIPPNPHARVEEPEFARILDFPNKGNVPERLQAAKFVAEISDDRYNQALRKYESGRMGADELNTIKAERDKALAEHSRLAEQSRGLASRQPAEPTAISEGVHNKKLELIGKITDPSEAKTLFQEYDSDLQYAKKDNDANEIERLGQLRDEAQDRWQQLTGKKMPPEEPLFARSEQGGIKIGQNIKRSAKEVTTGYSRPLSAIMIREGWQNAGDATRHLGKEGRIHISVNDDGFSIRDNGKGMSRKELETVFSDLYESGKTQEETATGGKGIGKASYMLGGKHFKVETVSFQGGKKVKITAEGTPDEFSEHVPVNEEIVPLQTPTGTTITTQFEEGQDALDARVMADRIMKNTRNSEQKVTINRYGVDENEKEFQSTKNEKIIHKSNIDGNDITISMPKSVLDLKNRRSTEVNYLNNGMYQFSKWHYFDKETPFMPADITVDIHPTAEEGTVGYPFPTQRESIKDALDEQIKDLIDEKLAKPQQQAKQTKLRELYQSMPEVADAGTKRKAVLYDPGNRLTPAELTTLQRSPVVNQLIKHYDDFIDNVLNKIGNDKWSERLEGVGIVLDPGMHGVHIPNPDTGKSTILMNPFIRMNEHDPETAALGTTFTGLHEVAHIGTEEGKAGVQLSEKDLADPRVGQYLQQYLHQVEIHGGLDMGHGIDFVKRLAEVLSKAGVEETFDAANEVKSIITNKFGKLNPDAERILQIYSESRGRPETTEDLLSPTGEQSKSGRVGKGNTTGGNRPDGEGTPPRTPVQSALKKLANAVISSKGLREEQELLYKKEQARRFAAFGRVKTTGEAGARESLGKLKGEMPKLNIEELQLTPKERDSLFDSIKQSSISDGEKATGYQALYKLLSGGHVPQRGELHILDTVFGGGMGMEGGPGAASEYEILSNILKAAAEPAKARPIKESSMPRQIYETTRGLMSVDIPFMSSAAFRQGVGLAGTARWFQAVGEQARVFGSEPVYDKIMKDLDNNMIHIRRVTWNPEKQRSELKSIADQIGLKTSDLKNISRREEQIKSSLLERLPVFKQTIGAYARASNRSYTVMLNSLRTHTAEDWIKAANILDKNGNITDLATARRIGYTINELSGGSSLDIDLPFSRFTGSQKGLKLDKFSDELSLVFFSPKMLMRDARMMNPLNYMKTDKIMRMEYLKGALRRAAVWAGFTGLAALGLGAVVSNNITSSDFAKARIKNTRADAGSGLLQWMVLISRQALGKNTSSSTGRTTDLGSTVVSPTRMDLLTQFIINRLHPTLGLGALALTATKTRPFYPISSTVEHVTPMYTSDIHDLMNSDPEIRQIILGLAAGSLSMGSITYGREDYGKPQYKIPYDPKFEGGPFGSSRRNPPIRRMNLSF